MADSVNDTERLKSLKSAFVADFRAESEWRKDKALYGRFYDGDQLTQEEIDALNLRGQPEVVINRIKPKLDSLFGTQIEMRVDTKAYPRGSREQEAENISEEFRRIEDQSDFDTEESKAFEDITIEGRAWYKTYRRWDGLESEQITECVSNDDIIKDRYSKREDLRDCKKIHETVWQDLSDAKDLFRGKDEILNSAVLNASLNQIEESEGQKEYVPDQYRQAGGSTAEDEDYTTFVDEKKKRVRIVTTYYRTAEVRKFLTTRDGKTTDITEMSEADQEKAIAAFENAVPWTDTVSRLHSATFCWSGILEEKKDIRPFDKEAKFPFVEVIGYRTRDKKKKPYGIVKQQLDPQREVNKRRSKMLHLLNVNQYMFESGAFDDENKARTELAKPDAWVKRNIGFSVERIQHTELAASQFQLLHESKQEIDNAGVNRELEGRSSASSGRDFQLRQQQALQPIRKLFVNLAAARKRVALYWLDDILQNNPDLQVNKYDLVIEEAPDTLSLRQETFETMAGLASKGFPIPPDILLEASPLAPEMKKNILGRMQEQQAQQAAMMQAQAAQGVPA